MKEKAARAGMLPAGHSQYEGHIVLNRRLTAPVSKYALDVAASNSCLLTPVFVHVVTLNKSQHAR